MEERENKRILTSIKLKTLHAFQLALNFITYYHFHLENDSRAGLFFFLSNSLMMSKQRQRGVESELNKALPLSRYSVNIMTNCARRKNRPDSIIEYITNHVQVISFAVAYQIIGQIHTL